jgi:hypothetical protein
VYALALLDFNCNDTSAVIETFQAATPYALGSVGNATLYSAFVRGRAYLAAHEYFGVNPLIEIAAVNRCAGLVVSVFCM